MSLNRTQRKALSKLESALEACGEVGISLFGADGNIIAFDTEELNEKEKEVGEIYEARSQVEHTTVSDHGVYLDSFGW